MFPVDGGTEVKGKQSGGGGGAAAGQTERPYGWKGGMFSQQEEDLIISLHEVLGNRYN